MVSSRATWCELCSHVQGAPKNFSSKKAFNLWAPSRVDSGSAQHCELFYYTETSKKGLDHEDYFWNISNCQKAVMLEYIRGRLLCPYFDRESVREWKGDLSLSGTVGYTPHQVSHWHPMNHTSWWNFSHPSNKMPNNCLFHFLTCGCSVLLHFMSF